MWPSSQYCTVFDLLLCPLPPPPSHTEPFEYCWTVCCCEQVKKLCMDEEYSTQAYTINALNLLYAAWLPHDHLKIQIFRWIWCLIPNRCKVWKRRPDEKTKGEKSHNAVPLRMRPFLNFRPAKCLSWEICIQKRRLAFQGDIRAGRFILQSWQQPCNIGIFKTSIFQNIYVWKF